jgi:hypothetical protein
MPDQAPPGGGLGPIVWYLAVCHRCEPDLAEPFRDEDERDTHAAAHLVGTGHTVVISVEGFDALPGLHMSAVVKRTEGGEFKFLCPAGDCQRWNGPYGTAQLAIASWRAHKPARSA